MDPHGWVSQAIGFVAAFLVLAHGIPSLVKAVNALNNHKIYTESKVSLYIRIVLGMLTGTWGICICQLSPVVGGFGSVIVLTSQLVIIYILGNRSVTSSLDVNKIEVDSTAMENCARHTDVRDGQLEIVQYLCRCTDVDPQNNCAVLWTSNNGHINVAQYLRGFTNAV